MIHQELNLIETLSAAENIFLGRERVSGVFLMRREMEEESKPVLQEVGARFAPDTPLSPRPKPTAAKRTSAPTHGQNHQALQNTFDFSTPVSGEAAQTNSTASQSAANPSDDLGAAFTGPTLAGTAFALDPDHFDTDV